MSYQLKQQDLRTGNQIVHYTLSGPKLIKVDWRTFSYMELFPEVFQEAFAPVPLTEPIMRLIRCQYHKEHHGIEFRECPPGERQVENNYYSRELIDNRVLHLSPNYDGVLVEGKLVKAPKPKYWFIWLCSHGTGSGWFLNIRDRRFELRYLHELQNIYHSISGMELFLKEEFAHLATV